MTDLRKPLLSDYWSTNLSELMHDHFPQVIEEGALVDHWKRVGWNDGTTTLFGVYERDGKYFRCSFPDYGEPTLRIVTPRIEHTGWDDNEEPKL